MTFEDYILNPMGRSNAVLSVAMREAQRNIYTTKFDNILLRENGKINYYLYKGKNCYYVHIKIPSEVVHNFYYDVVIKFIKDQKVAANLSKLNKWQVQFFSNDPSFVFTYAYVFKKKDMFIKELSSKMSTKALTKSPDITNKEQMVGYVKSIYFAYLFMQQRGLFNPIRYEGVPDLDMKYLLSQIEQADKKIEDRQDKGQEYSKKKEKRISQGLANKMMKMGVSDDTLAKNNYKITTTKKVGVVKNKATNMTRKTKSAKRI